MYIYIYIYIYTCVYIIYEGLPPLRPEGRGRDAGGRVWARFLHESIMFVSMFSSSSSSSSNTNTNTNTNTDTDTNTNSSSSSSSIYMRNLLGWLRLGWLEIP